MTPVRTRRAPAAPRKTYSHLAPARRMPSEYELGSTHLLWYPKQGGFEVELPLGAWYARHQTQCPLRCDDWDRFVDPRETTYAKYVGLARTREDQADGVMRVVATRAYDEGLSAGWVATLERVLPVVRYPAHAMQMIAAYCGQLAPGGRLVIACAFQAADEWRRIQRVSERTVQIRRAHAGFGENARAVWERDPAWQPARELLERALVVWDWGEALVALGLCIAPLFDQVVMARLPDVATRRGDPMLLPFFASLDEDCAWHREWAGAFVSTALAASPDNRAVIDGWTATWVPRARAAVRALDEIWSPESLAGAAIEWHDVWLSSLGLSVPR